MLTYFLYGLFILSCIVLVVAVLLQPGKADAGALFTSSVSSTAFGPRGTASLLAKITIGAASLFMLIALILSLPIFGTRSVLQSTADETTPAASPTRSTALASGICCSGGRDSFACEQGNSNAPPRRRPAYNSACREPQASPAQK